MNQKFNKVSKESKTIWLVILGIVLLIGGILAWQYWWVPKEEGVLNETATRKTYRNEEYGFEFEYPKGWKISSSNPAEILLQSIKGGNDNFRLKISPFSQKTSLPQIIIEETGVKGSSFEQGKIRIGKVDGIWVSSKACAGAGCLIFDWFIVKNDYLYHFEQTFPNIAYDENFNTILSTFKFTEKDETADWKTYRNKEYGFEFKYPAIYDEKEEYKSCRLRESINKNVNPQLFVSVASRVWLQILDSEGLTFPEYVNKVAKKIKIESEENICIGEKEAINISYRIPPSNAYGLMTLLKKDKKIYMFSLERPVSECFEIENISVFTVYGKMLSTFRFLE